MANFSLTPFALLSARCLKNCILKGKNGGGGEGGGYWGLTLYQQLWSYHGENKVGNYSVFGDRISGTELISTVKRPQRGINSNIERQLASF